MGRIVYGWGGVFYVQGVSRLTGNYFTIIFSVWVTLPSNPMRTR